MMESVCDSEPRYRGANGTSDRIELMKFRLQGAFHLVSGRTASPKAAGSSRGSPSTFFFWMTVSASPTRPRPEYSFDGCVADLSQGSCCCPLAPSGTRCGHEPRKFDYFYSCRNGVWNARGDREARSVSVFAASTRLLGFAVSAARALLSLPTKSARVLFLHFAVSAILTRSSAILGLGLAICGQASFPDHHRYTSEIS